MGRKPKKVDTSKLVKVKNLTNQELDESVALMGGSTVVVEKEKADELLKKFEGKVEIVK